MKALGGDGLWVRPGSSDLVNALSYYATGAYLPPPEVDRADIRSVCELGTNIGAALTALGVRFPNARLVGVEAEEGNADVAERNLARFGDRASLVRSAIWSTDTELILDRSSTHGEHGFLVRPRRPDDTAAQPDLHAISIDSLVTQEFESETIDYMHVSIEGSEEQALRTAERWPHRVRSLRIELHPYFGFGAEQCIPRLENLGYRAWVAPRPRDKWVFAVRD